MHSILKSFALVLACVWAQSAYGVVILELRVDIVEAGPVAPGTTVNWNLFASVSTSDATNFGVSSLDIDLTESANETLTTATIAAPFTDYLATNGGVGAAGSLIGITAIDDAQDGTETELIDPINGGSLAEILFASGSFTVNALGVHTLTPSQGPGADIRRFSGAGQALGASVAFDAVNFTSDSVVVAVPEPSSLGLFCVATAFLSIRRRKRA